MFVCLCRAYFPQDHVLKTHFHVVTGVRILPFLRRNNIPPYLVFPCVCSWTLRLVSYFTIVKSGVMNLSIQISFHSLLPILWGIDLAAELSDHIFRFLRNLHTIFQSSCIILQILPTMLVGQSLQDGRQTAMIRTDLDGIYCLRWEILE